MDSTQRIRRDHREISRLRVLFGQFARLDARPAKRRPAPARRPWRRRIADATPTRPVHPARKPDFAGASASSIRRQTFSWKRGGSDGDGARRARRTSRNFASSLGIRIVDSCFLHRFKGGGILSAARNLPFLLRRDNPADDSHYFAARPHGRSPAWSRDSQRRLESPFGLPVMFLAQAMAGFTSFDCAGDGGDLIARGARRNGQPVVGADSRRSPCRKPA